ncbi:MAG: BON domain-containing protein [Pirellulales bacterium]
MRNEQVPDRVITQQVHQKLSNRGVRSPCHVSVQVKRGEVTLSGSVQFAHQKGAAVQVTSTVAGVRRVVDQMIVKPHVKR